MIDQPRPFSQRLIECEAPTPALQEQYRKEINAMFEKKLGPWGRAMWVFWTVFGLAMGTFFAVVAVYSYGKLPVWVTAGFGLGAAFGLAYAVLSGWIAWSGRYQLKTQAPAIVGLTWVFTVLYVTLLLVFAPHSIVGLRMLVSALFFLVFAAVFLLAGRTEQAELRTKEKLLEIEYRLVDLAEQLERN
jgi:MFS family permease